MRNDSRHVLFVHAHPDDETLATGGTIATLVDAGIGVTVVTCTRGELGEVIPPELADLAGDGSRLAEHRIGELAEAMRVLGVSDHRFLGEADARHSGLPPRRYLDSGMVWGADGPEPVDDPHAESLCSAPLAEVAADIAAVIASVHPDAVVSYDARGGYGHPDHIRVHEATVRAAEAMAVPYFAIEPDEVPAGPDSLQVDISAVLQRKLQALQAHRTQVTVDGELYALSSGPHRRTRAEERFRRVEAPGEAELSFAAAPLGARALACAIAVVLGVGAGVLGTISHPSTLPLAGVEVPTGLVAALVVVTALLVGLRLVFGSRAPSAFAAAGIAVVLLVFAQVGPGGSVLVPADLAGYTWTYGVPLVAALVLAWPRLPVRSGD